MVFNHYIRSFEGFEQVNQEGKTHDWYYVAYKKKGVIKIIIVPIHDQINKKES